MHRLAAAVLAVASAALVSLTPMPAAAEVIGGNPGPQYNYICPNADGKGALDCYFDAVQHLYTMCRNVKAIEIIEFGYEDSQEGVNSAKYEYCLDKQKRNMAAPYQAALKEARVSTQAVEGVKSLHEHWLASLQHIRWNRGETDETYKARVVKVYDEFREKIEGIRTIVALVREKTSPIGTAQAKTPEKKAAKATGKTAAHSEGKAQAKSDSATKAPAKSATTPGAPKSATTPDAPKSATTPDAPKSATKPGEPKSATGAGDKTPPG